jgi:hypothetical protein
LVWPQECLPDAAKLSGLCCDLSGVGCRSEMYLSGVGSRSEMYLSGVGSRSEMYLSGVGLSVLT